MIIVPIVTFETKLNFNLLNDTQAASSMCRLRVFWNMSRIEREIVVLIHTIIGTDIIGLDDAR